MFTVKAQSNYSTQEFETIEEARKYAESITDSTNKKTTVYDGDQYDSDAVAAFAYTNGGGGATMEVNV